MFRCVGRLDKGTSGVVVCALNRYAAARLSGNINKRYMAVVRGHFEGSGTVNKPIYRPDPMKTLRACGDMPGSESAVTHWESLYAGDEYSLLSLRLETGRTHQIRVHFASEGAPLAGDTMYGAPEDFIGHHLLHCAECGFVHPASGEEVRLCAPPPQDFADFCRSFIPEDTLVKIFNNK